MAFGDLSRAIGSTGDGQPPDNYRFLIAARTFAASSTGARRRTDLPIGMIKTHLFRAAAWRRSRGETMAMTCGRRDLIEAAAAGGAARGKQRHLADVGESTAALAAAVADRPRGSSRRRRRRRSGGRAGGDRRNCGVPKSASSRLQRHDRRAIVVVAARS